MNGTASRVATLLVSAIVAACGQHRPPGPPVPTGRPVVPTSQQQAQDTVLGYLKKTLAAFPSGTVFDRARYAGSGNAPCNDEPTGVPPNEFSDIRDAIFPPDTDPDAMIAKVGEIWQGWGWYVRERDGFGETEPIGLCAGWVQSPNRQRLATRRIRRRSPAFRRAFPESSSETTSEFRRPSKPTPDERFSPGPAVHAGG